MAFGRYDNLEVSLMKITWPGNIHPESLEGEQLPLFKLPAVKACAHSPISISFNASELKGSCTSDEPGEALKKIPYHIALSKLRESIFRVKSGRLL